MPTARPKPGRTWRTDRLFASPFEQSEEEARWLAHLNEDFFVRGLSREAAAKMLAERGFTVAEYDRRYAEKRGVGFGLQPPSVLAFWKDADGWNAAWDPSPEFGRMMCRARARDLGYGISPPRRWLRNIVTVRRERYWRRPMPLVSLRVYIGHFDFVFDRITRANWHHRDTKYLRDDHWHEYTYNRFVRIRRHRHRAHSGYRAYLDVWRWEVHVSRRPWLGPPPGGWRSEPCR